MKLYSGNIRRARAGALCTVILLFIASAAGAATITVINTNDSGTGSLRQALNDAATGDTVDFALPDHSTISLSSGELFIGKSLTIAGPGANLLTVQHFEYNIVSQRFRIFDVEGPNDVTISGLTIHAGSAENGGGGGIFGTSRTLTIAGCTISSNDAGQNGGGVFYDGGPNSKLTITNTTIKANEAGESGGGLYIVFRSNGQSAVIVNSTISGNVSAASGGGVFVTTAGTSATAPLGLSNSTITENEAWALTSDPVSQAGGGVFNSESVVTASNTIIAGNRAPNGSSATDFAEDLVSQGYNLIGDTNGAFITGNTTGNQYGVDPKLDTLRDNGGPTVTHRLLSGSPAIDAGNSGAFNIDQRGFARPVDSPTAPNASGGDGSDIGAFEVQPDQLPGCDTINTTVQNNNDSGSGSLRDVIASVCNGSTITFAPNVRGAINLTSGELAVNKSLTIDGPAANLLSVQRSAAAGTPEFRIFDVGNFNVAISGLTIANGKVSGFTFGGGILNAGVLTLTGTTIFGNSAGFSGGGISNNGTVDLINSTVSSNVANSGGGIAGATLNVTNSTVTGNIAQTGNGGGITVGTVTLANSTISGNSAPSGNGGGVFNNGVNGATLRAKNTIIALNTAAGGADVSGALTSGNFNLIGNASGATITPAQFGDLLGSSASPIDPRLGPLQDNGGPTPTLALLSGSPAIDHASSLGFNRALTTDQRGSNRTSDFPSVANISGGDGTDIGAFEAPVPSSTRLANISTRLRVETGNNVLIGGFIVTGTQPKKVIVRGIGPSLPFAGHLDNPTIELRDASGALVDSNDDWVNSPNKQAIIDSTIPPSNDLESAIVATLPANNAGYTVIVRGVNDGTGIGVVEAYDLDGSVDSKLANISTRGFVQTGDNVLIAGTIVVGETGQKVIVRAIGPSLNFAGVLANPTLELRDQNGGLVEANDNWVDSPNKQAIIDSTIPPKNDLESAIVATLQGNGASYTAIVRGVNGTTGIATVEVYALQ